MFEELATIANQEFAEALKTLKREKSRALHALLEIAGKRMGRSEEFKAKEWEVEIEYARKTCRAFVEIWIVLFEDLSRGVLTPKHLDFVRSQLTKVAGAEQRKLIHSRLRDAIPPHHAAVSASAASEMQKIEREIASELEVRFRPTQPSVSVS
jgi:hypothetical protein